MFQQFTINKDYKYVYQFLKEQGFSERYMSFLRKEMGRIKRNNLPVNIKSPLKTGDKLEVIADNNHKSEIKPCIIPLDIVYEDAYYLLVNKPAGLATIPTKSHYNENLAGGIVEYLSKAIDNFTMRFVNRLDKDTAGIVMVAKNLMSANALKETSKTYYAICEGSITEDIVVNKPIKTIIENNINVRKRVIAEDGKDAVTYVHPIKTYKDYTLVRLSLKHGRTHQIRVHLSSIGHPLLGDSIYGKQSKLINHTALVCKEFSFFHPYLNKELNFTIDYPEDFKNLIK